jgi:hypothetical protein
VPEGALDDELDDRPDDLLDDLPDDVPEDLPDDERDDELDDRLSLEPLSLSWPIAPLSVLTSACESGGSALAAAALCELLRWLLLRAARRRIPGRAALAFM